MLQIFLLPGGLRSLLDPPPSLKHPIFRAIIDCFPYLSFNMFHTSLVLPSNLQRSRQNASRWEFSNGLRPLCLRVFTGISDVAKLIRQLNAAELSKLQENSLPPHLLSGTTPWTTATGLCCVWSTFCSWVSHMNTLMENWVCGCARVYKCQLFYSPGGKYSQNYNTCT